MSHLSHQIQFFLGTNSPEGFVSLYHQWANQEQTLAFYVLKGGPGCGKSTLMRQTAKQLEAAGVLVEYILCSGDPDSLDGIAVPQKRAALMDGTAPHRIDPAYPGVTGHYVDLSTGYDRAGLFAQRDSILAAAQAYRACYPKAYDCFAEGERIRQHSHSIFHTQNARRRAEQKAMEILDQEIPHHGTQSGKRSQRFLGALTYQGKILLEETAAALCSRIFAIKDSCGLSSILLQHLEQGFLSRGCDVLSCPSPEQPGKLEHILIPSLSLALITNPSHGSASVCTTVETKDFAESSVWQENESLLNAAHHMAEREYQKGIRFLKDAKEKHDALEAMYYPFMDFSQNQARAEQIASEILALPDLN